jgi:hypothetical protein
MHARVVVLVLMGISLSLPAMAVDVDLAVNTSSQYDTNVTRSDGGKEGDFSFRIGPTIVVRDDIQKLRYRVRYSPVYQKFVEQDEFDKLSHFASGDLDYVVGDKTSLSLSERFSFTQSINQQALGSDQAGVGSPQTETRRGDITVNVLTLEARHSFTPRLSGQSTFTHQYFDSENEDTAQNTSFAGSTGLTYAIAARDRVGGGGGVTHQQFDKVSGKLTPTGMLSRVGQTASESITYRIFASWSHNFSENNEFSIRGGPALISTKQDGPTPVAVALFGQDAGSTKDTSLTYFGEASFSHAWAEKLRSVLSYNRSDSSASSLGSSTVADRATFLTKWDPMRRLNLTLRGDWVQRKSTNDLREPSLSGGNTTDRAVDTTYYSASVRAAYSASRRITLSARLTYQKQENEGESISSSSDFGDFIVFLGFRYEFDPFHF